MNLREQVMMGLIVVGLWLCVPIANAADSEAPDAALEATCAQAATVMPKVGSAVMLGRGNPRKQGVGINVFLEAMPVECRPDYTRVITGSIFMKNGNQKHPVRLVKETVRYVYNEFIKIPGSVGRGPAGHNGWPRRLLYKCTRGPRATKVYGLITRQLTLKQSGEVAASKTAKVPVVVKRPGPC